MSKFILSGFADEIDQDLSLQISEMNRHGIGYIEARGINGKNIGDYTVEEILEVKKQLDEGGIKVSALGSPFGKINIKDDFEPHFEKFKNGVELAKALGTKYIRAFSFFFTDGASFEEYRDEVISRVKRMVDYAAENDIIYLHENEKGIYGDTAERCLDILKTIDSPNLRATFDPANFVQCGEDTLKAYEMLKDYIEYMHIKDARYADDVVVPAGMGDGNVKAVLANLKNDGFEGFVSLEPHLGHFDGLDDLELDADFSDMEQAGPKTFAVAVSALKGILEEI